MRNITVADLLCPCCGQGVPSILLLAGLNEMQQTLGTELTINSACRCPKHNTAVGGAPHSEHLHGNAADVKAAGRNPLELYLAADEYPPFSNGGIGLYPGDFIHVDVRPAHARWFRNDGRDHPITDYLTHPHRS